MPASGLKAWLFAGRDVTQCRASKQAGLAYALIFLRCSFHGFQHCSLRRLMTCAALSDPLERQRRFLKLWTLKEAYVKAVGRGISGYPGLAGFTVDPRPRKSAMGVSPDTAADKPTGRTDHARAPMPPEEVSFVPPEGESAGEWRFELMQPTPQHVAAVCVRSQDQTERCKPERTVHIISREVLPLVWDQALEQGTDLAAVDRMMPMSKL